MAQIYTIQASDAPQHTGKLQTILQNLQSQNRIRRFVNTEADSDLSSITGAIKEGDLILIVLTHQLDSKREQIETELKALKAERPEIRVGEIIVDKVPYENEFIIFPADLRDIRSREDMDEAWNSIEQSLKNMFPEKKEPEPVPPPPVNWPKYLKIAGAVVGVLLILFLIKMWSDGGEPTAERVPVEVEARPAEVEEARPALRLSAPVPVSPSDGTVFDHFPRTTTLTWRPVNGAASYVVERTFLSPGQVCSQHADSKRPHVVDGITETSHRFNFVGAQPGCWRVYAVAENGTQGEKSAWSQFTYTR